jgi:transposase InsO family protein
MRSNSQDKTIDRNYLQRYQFLIESYEKIKRKAHPDYKRVGEFYKAHGTCRQTFLKYYGRYRNSGRNPELLMPGKRGPVYKTRRTIGAIEEEVLKIRERGCNRYEIHHILKESLEEKAPSASCIYKILRRHGKNRLSKPMKEEKRRIIKEKAGELGHIDSHYLSKDMIAGSIKRYYLVCVLDSCTRVAWAEIVEDIKAITVMFATLRCFNHIQQDYRIQFEEVMTDNGSEFGPSHSQRKDEHPFERMLIEMGIKHRYIKPYRPQTNGKVERFWRSLNEDLINGTYFDSLEHFKHELLGYIVYYNKHRPHQGLNGLTPHDFRQRIT